MSSWIWLPVQRAQSPPAINKMPKVIKIYSKFCVSLFGRYKESIDMFLECMRACMHARYGLILTMMNRRSNNDRGSTSAVTTGVISETF